MELRRPAEIIQTDSSNLEKIYKESLVLLPWLFKHKNLDDKLENAKKIDKKSITNIFNHIHFIDEQILIHMVRPQYEEAILVKAYPDPCYGREISCNWSDMSVSGVDFKQYHFLHILIDDGKSIIIVPGELKELSRDSLIMELPEESHIVCQRRAKRHSCRNITVELTQNGFQAKGELLDFSPLGFRLKVRPEPNCSFNWYNPDELVTILLRRDNKIIFSGNCRCIRQDGKPREREIVLERLDERIRRFKKKQYRSFRHRLVPGPGFIFDHPLLNKRIELECLDISTSGFSVYEDNDESVLMPGLIIPDLVINFPGGVQLKCDAQVIYSNNMNGDGVRSGISILDMSINEYTTLTHILTSALDIHANNSRRLDMDALWEFFFDTGFIYPNKYKLIHSNREYFKETYRRLYQESPEIARHFTSQRQGKIYGHMSMLRAYEKTWLIQHHAARAMGSQQRTGFLVLKQIMHFMNDMYRLPSANMDYVMCYYRPENKFPARVFGGFAKVLNDLQGCSEDLFAYLPYTSLSLGMQLPVDWDLKESTSMDLWELNRFYEHHSGGLFMDSLGPESEPSGDESIEMVFKRLGFSRECKFYSLLQNGKLTAILIANHSDLGINLSELLNCIKVIVIREDIPWNILSIAVSKLTTEYDMERVPVLFYPFEYVEKNNIPFEKRYILWIYDAHFVSPFMEYMQKRFKISYKLKNAPVASAIQ